MVNKPQALFHLHSIWMSNNNKEDFFFPLGLFSSTDYSSYFLASYSAAVEHFENKKQCSTTHQYLSVPSLDIVLEEEIGVTDLDGFFCFYGWGFFFHGQFISMR